MGQLVMGRTTVKCRCGKIVGLSLEDAKMQCRKYAKKHDHHNNVRYYQCRFGCWHWTSQVAIPERYAPEQAIPEPAPAKTAATAAKPCKPKLPHKPDVHHIGKVDWNQFEPAPGRDGKAVIQHAHMRPGKWFYRTPDGTGGYAKTLLEAATKLATLAPETGVS